MSSRETGPGEHGSGQDGHLTDVLPIDRAAIESLSWGLGSRVTGGDAPPQLDVHNQGANASLSVFEATDYTYIVRFRTPVGREKFFGVAGADLRPMLEELLDGGEWTVRQGRLDRL
ncbi:hypothetical protein [Halorhabdus amylolytica]|uniref:hypothetical protein n=1 Tax=Halorhabdus amylolytica TaxID=2559573 RepID=UPI0010A9B955|nr:hypothetical protein [Halorhabdus amylolytica]